MTSQLLRIATHQATDFASEVPLTVGTSEAKSVAWCVAIRKSCDVIKVL